MLAFLIDYAYVLLLPAILLSLYAEIRVKSAFRKYSRVRTARGVGAAQVARDMLADAGLSHVTVECVPGSLTDHYDPRSDVVRLSQSVYLSDSPAAIGVAAHEVGHAIQYARGYLPVRVRGALVGVTNFASRAAWVFILLGAILAGFSELYAPVLAIGVLLFSLTTLFSLVTLPCELDASARARRILAEGGEYSRSDLSAVAQVLRAAALTYVAALLVSVLQLLRLVGMLGRSRR